MANTTISALPSATTPLAGTEVVPIVQSGVTKKVAVSAISGGVTSVGLSAPAFLSVSGSPVTSSGTLALSYSGTAIPIANGGTGQTTANAALNGLLPSQTSQSGKVLSTDGTNTSWIAAGGMGTVQSVSVSTANGFAGTVANATTNPAITLTTSITGVLKGNGSAISAATAGTDYQAPITLTTIGTSGAATFAGNVLNIPQYSGGSATPGGSPTQVQYNNSGAFGGSANLTFDGTTLTAAGLSGPHNGTVGATTANTGAFTTLSASSIVSGTGFSTYLASPPAIGGTAPAAGTFTTAKAIAASTQDAVQLQGRAGGTSSYVSTITPTTLTASRTLTLPDATGTLLISGGDLGTPSAGVVTNLTGTASININGTVGATTPTTGVFTTSTARAAATQDSVILQGRAGGTGSFGVTLTPTTLTASRTLTLPDASGTILQSGTAVTVGQGGTGLTSGTSGGIPYFSSTSAITSSAALAANALVVGGGAGSSPATVTTGTGVVTALGVNTGSAGAFVVNGGALGTPSSGTLTSVTGLPLTSGVTGILPIANGGTNASTASITSFNNITGYTASGATGTTSTNLVFSTSPTLVTPVLGTPTSVTLTNGTGLPISTGVSGLGTGVATFLATPSSANLASAVTDETGSGLLVFGTTPALTNPTVTNYVETLYSANTSTAITVDLANGTVQNLTLTGNATITMPTAVAGKSFIINLSQDATGSRTVTWSTVSWPSGTAPTITSTASKKDIYSFFSNGTSWFGTTIGQNY